MAGGIKTSLHYDRSQTNFSKSFSSRIAKEKATLSNDKALATKKEKAGHKKERHLFKNQIHMIERRELSSSKNNIDDFGEIDDELAVSNPFRIKKLSSNKQDLSDDDEADPGKHNLFVQLKGSRKFVLFPPHLTSSMEPMEEEHLNHISRSTTFLHSLEGKEARSSAFSRYPSLEEVWKHRIEVTLQEGDALLIPARWWHYTHVLTPGMALNWWFSRDCMESRYSR